MQLIFIAGGRVVVQTLLAGDIQLGISAPGAVIRSDLAGGDLVFVAVASSTPGFGLVSRKEITRVEQLPGKRIGIGQFGADPIGLKPEEISASFRCARIHPGEWRLSSLVALMPV